MIVCTGVTVTFWIGCTDFAQNDDASWTAIDAQCTTCAHIVIDDEKNVVGWI